MKNYIFYRLREDFNVWSGFEVLNKRATFNRKTTSSLSPLRKKNYLFFYQKDPTIIYITCIVFSNVPSYYSSPFGALLPQRHRTERHITNQLNRFLLASLGLGIATIIHW